jgi:hypothetical protein
MTPRHHPTQGGVDQDEKMLDLVEGRRKRWWIEWIRKDLGFLLGLSHGVGGLEEERGFHVPQIINSSL